jgi:ActR/RegA family two-component response regulator
LIVAQRNIQLLKLKQALEHNGYQVYWAETSAEALDKAKLNCFDLIVLDLEPSAEKGLSLYQELQRYPELASLSMVILAPYQHLSRQMIKVQEGMIHFLAKDAMVEARLLQLIELTHYLRYRYLDLVPS